MEEKIELLVTQTGHAKDSPELRLYILNNVIRPKFSLSKPDTITPAGRKKTTPNPLLGAPTTHTAPDVPKPWRDEETSALLQWTVRNSDESFVKAQWHLFVPPLLTLLDDFETDVRIRGLEVLRHLLAAGRVSGGFLLQTGMGDVFEDAVFPTLLFLPGITPVDEAVRLLPATYSALFLLFEVRFPKVKKDGRVGLLRALDRVMREGLLPGLLSCKDHVRIVKVLVVEMGVLVGEMGLHAVKHLKDVIPILSTILCDPFVTSQPTLVLASLKTIQTVMLNCWPRISQPVHYLELVKAISLCWASTEKEKASSSSPLAGDQLDETCARFESVTADLIITGQILCACLPKNKLSEQVEPLVKIDPSLRAVFTSRDASSAVTSLSAQTSQTSASNGTNPVLP